MNPKMPMAVGPYATSAIALYGIQNEPASERYEVPKKVILEVAEEFAEDDGQKIRPALKNIRCDDAEMAVVVINSTAGTAKFVVDQLREQGVKAGLVKIRVYRPFPGEELAEALKGCKAIAVLDKADSFNAAGGPLFTDVTSAMYGRAEGIKVINYIYGLGGRDVKTNDIEKVYADLAEIVKTGKVESVYNYLGVRE